MKTLWANWYEDADRNISVELWADKDEAYHQQKKDCFACTEVTVPAIGAGLEGRL